MPSMTTRRPADQRVPGCSSTMDAERRELDGGWVTISERARRRRRHGAATAGPGDARRHRRARHAGSRQHAPSPVPEPHPGPPADDEQRRCSSWLQTLYPLWRALDTEAAYLSAWVGLAELALSGCTTSTDHLYLHPRGAGDLLAAEIEAAAGPRHALPPDARLDVVVREGRRPSARRRGRRRRRDPRRQ